ncbi:MAG: hypothetical protein OXC13_06600 [Caldilineaceae bacterium]|nr:hypothetical protein [Caldilineaceae bacterium]
MHDNLITLALKLVFEQNDSTQDQDEQAELRCAVRCAYYALFHMLSRQCADFFAGEDPSQRSRPAWVQAYRGLQHGTVRSRCGNSNFINRFPLEIRFFAEKFVQLQKARHSADYDPEARFVLESVLTTIDDAASAMAAFMTVSEKDRRAFVVYVTAPLPR